MRGVDKDGAIFIGRSQKLEYLALQMANRHGLVTGATGTGKTFTVKVIAEGLSRARAGEMAWPSSPRLLQLPRSAD